MRRIASRASSAATVVGQRFQLLTNAGQMLEQLAAPLVRLSYRTSPRTEPKILERPAARRFRDRKGAEGIRRRGPAARIRAREQADREPERRPQRPPQGSAQRRVAAEGANLFGALQRDFRDVERLVARTRGARRACPNQQCLELRRHQLVRLVIVRGGARIARGARGVTLGERNAGARERGPDADRRIREVARCEQRRGQRFRDREIADLDPVVDELERDARLLRRNLRDAQCFFATRDGLAPAARIAEHVGEGAQGDGAVTRILLRGTQLERAFEVTQRFAEVADRMVGIAETVERPWPDPRWDCMRRLRA